MELVKENYYVYTQLKIQSDIWLSDLARPLLHIHMYVFIYLCVCACVEVTLVQEV